MFLMLVLAPDLVNILTALASPFLDSMCIGVSPFCNNNNISVNVLFIGIEWPVWLINESSSHHITNHTIK